MSFFDSVGIKTVDEAAEKLSPLLNNLETRLRGIVYESVERLNGATIEAEIIEGKVRLTVKLPPVSPPAVQP